ncbi:MAG: hypothetical protein JWL76_604 [Thermoleophilia bacterium]|nr:hypothetical protein [Thermoleophilia bacterium]
MQLAPITQLPAVNLVAAPARIGAPASFRDPASAATTSVAPAPAAASASISGAVDGVAQLLAPLIDFPGIAAGQVFDIVKGSKVGFLGVKGEATITRFDDEGASFAVKAGAFGVKVDVVVDVQRTGPETVRISSRGTGIPNMDADGTVVVSRTNYAEFLRSDGSGERTVIQHDGTGGIVIDTVVPTFGNAHLVLERR